MSLRPPSDYESQNYEQIAPGDDQPRSALYILYMRSQQGHHVDSGFINELVATILRLENRVRGLEA